jgi:uncharacterized protein YecE (DUF72 family)
VGCAREALAERPQFGLVQLAIVGRGQVAEHDDVEAALVALAGGRPAAEVRQHAADDDRVPAHVRQDGLQRGVVESA